MTAQNSQFPAERTESSKFAVHLITFNKQNEAKRLVETFKSALVEVTANHQNSREYALNFLGYRVSPHEKTGDTPPELIKVRTPSIQFNMVIRTLPEEYGERRSKKRIDATLTPEAGSTELENRYFRAVTLESNVRNLK